MCCNALFGSVVIYRQIYLRLTSRCGAVLILKIFTIYDVNQI